MKKTSVEIGMRIRRKREELHLTREQLCSAIDISPHFLSEIERGKKGASAETVIKLCKGLFVSADYLLGLKNQHMISVDGLSENQINTINDLITYIRKTDMQK